LPEGQPLALSRLDQPPDDAPNTSSTPVKAASRPDTVATNGKLAVGRLQTNIAGRSAETRENANGGRGENLAAPAVRISVR
jgi:hypothetical protein